MGIIDQFCYIIMLSQVILYILQSGGFLVRLFNRPQKFINRILVESKVYFQLKIAYLVLICLMAVLFIETLSMWKWDLQLIRQHLDQTSLDAIEDREDLYRNERNMYIYGTAFFLSCANLRYMTHLNHYFDMENKIQFFRQGKILQ